MLTKDVKLKLKLKIQSKQKKNHCGIYEMWHLFGVERRIRVTPMPPFRSLTQFSVSADSCCSRGNQAVPENCFIVALK